MTPSLITDGRPPHPDQTRPPPRNFRRKKHSSPRPVTTIILIARVFQVLADFPAVHARHREIEDEDIGMLGPGHRQAFGAIRSKTDFPAQVSEVQRVHLAIVLDVVDDQDAARNRGQLVGIVFGAPGELAVFDIASLLRSMFLLDVPGEAGKRVLADQRLADRVRSGDPGARHGFALLDAVEA